MSFSLFTAISGLSTYQKMLDVTSDNISNLNTPGFKSASVRTGTGFSETLQEAVSPGAFSGGINPMQVGNGVNVSSIFSNFTQGSLNQTGRSLDLAIQGEGFFIINDGDKDLFTRVGSFALDSQNQLVDQATGFRVQSLTGNIIINPDEPVPPQQTSQVRLQGNLDTNIAFPGGAPVTTSISVFDVQGNTHALELSFTRTGAFTWDMSASLPNADGTIGTSTVTGITFNENGSFSTVSGTNNVDIVFNGLTTPQNISFNFGTAGAFDGLTQLGGESTATAVDQNGFETGNLLSFGIEPSGAITGRFSNGQVRELAQLAIATFSNPEGMERVQGNLYQSTANSGQAILGVGLSGRAGAVLGGNLESSNVDPSREIAQMIVAQRGFQVNARVITTANQVLEEVANLIR